MTDKKQPHIPLYTGDYIKDTRSLTLSGRGLWSDVLLFMWENGRTGSLTRYGVCEWARQASCSPHEFYSCLKELIRTGVADCLIEGNKITWENFDRDFDHTLGVTCHADVTACPKKITLINRRMSREHKTRENNRIRKQRQRSHDSSPENVTPLLSMSLSLSDFTDVKSSQRGDKSPLLSPEATKRAPTKASVPYDEIVSLYHEILPELPRVKLLTDKRKAWIKTRWNEDPQRQDLQWWREYFESVRDQAHLMGDNDRGWKADLEFLVKADKMARVLEKSYQRENKNGNHNGNEQAVMSWLNRKQA